jgi:hypothetical protein
MDELSELEQRIKHKIAQTKDKMHNTRERAVTDRLWPEIETLNWVLNEILVVNREPLIFFKQSPLNREIRLPARALIWRNKIPDKCYNTS